MANVDSPFGMKPVRYVSGAPYNGAANRYFVPAGDGAALFLGSPVKLTGTATSRGVAHVTAAAAGDTLTGVVVGVEPVTADSTVYREASTARYVLVADDPDLLFEVQEDSVGGALAAADVGLNADLIIGAGNTNTGISGVEIDSSSKVSTTAQVRIIGLADREDNEIGTNANWLVRIVEHRSTDVAGV